MKATSMRSGSGKRHHGRTIRDTGLSRDWGEGSDGLSRDACGAAPIAGTCATCATSHMACRRLGQGFALSPRLAHLRDSTAGMPLAIVPERQDTFEYTP